MGKPMHYYNPRSQYFIGGLPAAGAKLFFYVPNSNTKKDTYTDNTLGTTNPNPIILNSEGRPSVPIYLNGAYKVVFAASTDGDPPTSPIWVEDNVTTIAQLETVTTISTNHSVIETERDTTFIVDSSGGNITIALLAAATAGNGFVITIKKESSDGNTITIDANGSETIDGNTSVALTQQGASARLICDGTAWYRQYASSSISSIAIEDTRTNTIAVPFSLTATTSSTPANGIGTGQDFLAESQDEAPGPVGQIAFLFDNISSGAEDSSFQISLRQNGAAQAPYWKFGLHSSATALMTFVHRATSARTVTWPDQDINIADLIAAAAPTGSIVAYGAASAPTNWLLCDGSAISRSTYSGLFAIIGTSFGSGDGSTTFNLPDLRGRCPIGAGTGSGLTARVLGTTLGAETHQLTVNEMPTHSHSLTYSSAGGVGTASAYTRDNVGGSSSSFISSTGGNNSHNNMQPSGVVAFIIKYI